ncbi:hypothetical protein [Ruminococcus sp.]|uniref:hypothetical protein n=1 Tax=Ruminococcus sp. TaxID=41978 RepID=UPI0025FB0200|nr:hypothetical protein [Ruminococcus sp.]
MTATITSPSKKKSFFSIRFISNISQNMKLLITNMFFHLLCFPVLMGVVLREMYLSDQKVSYSDDSIPFVFIAFVAFIFSVVLGFVIPMINFRYLYNKTLVDMNYSLPLNNRQRFFADYISGLIVYLVPLFVGFVISAIEILIGSTFIDLHELFEYFPLILKISSIMIIGMIMQYSLAVLAIIFAGSTFEALFSIASINIMIPSFISITWINIVNAAHFGLDESSIIKNLTFFTTSPVGVCGYIIYYINILETSQFDYGFTRITERLSSFTDLSYAAFLIRSILFTVLIVMISFLLYKKRKAEDVSKPYVFKGFYYAIMTITIYCIVSLMKMTIILNGVVTSLIVSGIIWFVMEVIRRRGFKRFWKSVIGFAAVSVGVLGIIKFIDITNGLGRAKYLPSVSSVNNMVVNIYGTNEIENVNNRLLTDKQLISDIIEFNQEIVDRHFHPDNYKYEIYSKYFDQNNAYNNFDEISIDITYYTKSGAAYIRNYCVPSAMLTEFACDLYTSEEYAEQITKEGYKNSLCKGRGSYTIHVENPTEAEYCQITLTDKRGSSKIVEISIEEGKQLFEALRMDIANMSPEDLKKSDYYCELNDILINSACHNTTAFMDERDIKYNKTSKEMINTMFLNEDYLTIKTDPVYLFPIYAFTNSDYIDRFFNYLYHYKGYDSEYNHDLIKLENTLCLGIHRERSSYDYDLQRNMQLDNVTSVEKLLDIATPIVIDEKVIAEVQFTGSTLYVIDRPGNREILEEAMQDLKKYT